MNLSRHSPAPTRYVGIGLVVALHLAGIYALSAGLIRPPARQHEATVLVPTLDDQKRELPKPEPVKAEKPTLKAPDLRPIEPLPWDVAPTPRTDALPPSDATPTPTGIPNTGTGSMAGPATPPVINTGSTLTAPGAVCSVMPRPEVPVVSWSGEAVLQVVATVRGGRVVGTDFRVAQGAVDGKTRRALQRSVESALAGYQCQGDAMFQQDFAFRLD